MFDLGWVLETSPGEALGGTYEHPAVHRGEVIQHIAEVWAECRVWMAPALQA